ncbi:MAG: hypothetical protein OXG35_26965 [Acidobacteria bacterium]|nr:hypothetical protein [Acidobacteriota bacterium]
MRVTTPSPSSCFNRAATRGRDRWSSRAQCRSAALTRSVPPGSSATVVTRWKPGPTAALQASETLPGESGWSRNRAPTAAVVHRPAAVIDPPFPPRWPPRIRFTVM